MVSDLKPKLAAGAFLAASGVLFWLASPDISGVMEQPYVELVLLFTSLVAAVSLYFVYSILSEVTGK